MSLPAPYYQDDFVTLYHGDCLELLPHLEADVLVTDPPYGMGLRSGRQGQFGDLRIAGDDTPELRDQVLALWDGPALVFGRWSVPRPAAARMVLVWDKGGNSGMGDLSLPWKPCTEEIYVLGGLHRIPGELCSKAYGTAYGPGDGTSASNRKTGGVDGCTCSASVRTIG